MEQLSSLTVIDITILVTLLVAFLVGWTTGLIRFLSGFVSFLVSVLIAGRYSHVALKVLNEAWDLQGWMERLLSARLNLPAEAAKVPAVKVPSEIALKWLSAVPIPEAYKGPLAQRLSEWSASATSTAAEFLTKQIAAGLLNALIFALLVILISAFLAYFARFLAEQIQEIPLIGTADRLLGAMALVTQTALILSFVTIFVVPFLSISGAKELSHAFNESKLTPYLVELFEKIRGLLFGGGTRLWSE